MSRVVTWIALLTGFALIGLPSACRAQIYILTTQITPVAGQPNSLYQVSPPSEASVTVTTSASF